MEETASAVGQERFKRPTMEELVEWALEKPPPVGNLAELLDSAAVGIVKHSWRNSPWEDVHADPGITLDRRRDDALERRHHPAGPRVSSRLLPGLWPRGHHSFSMPPAASSSASVRLSRRRPPGFEVEVLVRSDFPVSPAPVVSLRPGLVLADEVLLEMMPGQPALITLWTVPVDGSSAEGGQVGNASARSTPSMTGSASAWTGGNGTLHACDLLSMKSLPGDWSRAIYPYGLLCGLLMAVSAYPMRYWDAPVPMIVVVLFVPWYIGAAFLAGRRGGVASAVTTGAVTALTGHVAVFLLTALYTLVNATWLVALQWLGLGAFSALLTAAIGAGAGAAGGMIAKVIKLIQP